LTNKVHISQQDDRIMLFEAGGTLLGAGASLVGNVIQVSGYSHITGFVYSDVASALNGVVIEQALLITDFPAGAVATTAATVSTTSYTAADIINNAFSVQIVAPFARIIYTNGAGAQTVFRLAFEARVLRGL
jgi:hypothetical protein